MRGFPGFINQKLGGAAPNPAALPTAVALAPKAPVLAAPALPAVNRPVVILPARPVLPPVVVMPTVRPVTLATITRNLQAALATEAAPAAPTTRGFPGFVSRNFNQVSQHQPGASSEKHLSGLANLFNSSATTAPERRQASRPAPTERPKVSRPATPSPLPAPAPNKKSEAAKAPVAAPKVAQTPAKAVTKQPKTSPAPAMPQPLTSAPAAPPPAAAKPVAAPAPAKLPAPVPVAAPSTSGPVNPTPAAPVLVPTGMKKPAESRTTPEAAPQPEIKIEAKTSPLDSQPRQAETAKPGPDTRNQNQDRAQSPAAPDKAVQQSPAALSRAAEFEKLAQTPREVNEGKVVEVQRPQVPTLQAPGAREQMAFVQENGAGLSAGGGFGSGGSGGHQGRQHRRQDEQDGPEEIASAEMLGGDDQVEWWLLRGQENLRALSSELREAVFLLRTPQRRLGEDFEQARKSRKAGQQAPSRPPQVQVRVEEEDQQTRDRVEMENVEPCRTCGEDLGGVDPRRCPACLHQAAQTTLELLKAAPRFLPYRVFLTACRQPVASRAVYRLRDFASLPSGAYWVLAA